MDIPSEKKVLKALVEEYKHAYGEGDSPAKDERLMIAEDYLSRIGINAEVRVAIDIQFTLMI